MKRRRPAIGTVQSHRRSKTNAGRSADLDTRLIQSDIYKRDINQKFSSAINGLKTCLSNLKKLNSSKIHNLISPEKLIDFAKSLYNVLNQLTIEFDNNFQSENEFVYNF